jgi:hypothetical protein
MSTQAPGALQDEAGVSPGLVLFHQDDGLLEVVLDVGSGMVELRLALVHQRHAILTSLYLGTPNKHSIVDVSDNTVHVRGNEPAGEPDGVVRLEASDLGEDAISISRGGKEAAAVASDQVNTIDIRAPCMHEAGKTRGGSQTSHGLTKTKRTRRMARTTIPWDCRIANLQRLKRNYLKKNTNINTQEGKRTFRSTKLKRSREPTPLVTAYAHQHHGRNTGKADSAKTLYRYREEGKRQQQQLLTKSIQ